MRWTLVLVTCIGCFAPSAQPGARCANGMCPEGLVCSPATDTCERTSTAVDDAGADTIPLDDAPLVAIDAQPDAPAPPMATMIQRAQNFSTSAATLAATLPAAPNSGNLLVMVGAAISGSLTSVTGGGATWTRATSSLINSNIEVWYGVTNGSNATVTINRTFSISSIWLVVFEWQGLDATSPLDVARSTNGTGTTVSAGSITTTNANDLVLFAVTANTPNSYSSGPSPGSWTALPGLAEQTITQAEWYRVVSSTGVFAPQVTQTGSFWEAAIVAFRLAQ